MSQLIWYPGHELLLKDIVHAENNYIYDSQGKKYVDLESGVWCTSIGHSNPRILRAIVNQAAQISHTGFNYANPVIEETASEILSLLGLEGGKCVFLCSGSESVEFGVRVAQSVAERSMFMTMADSYFGAYGSARRKQEDEWWCFDWKACAGCPEAKDCHNGCEHWDTIPFDRIGAFLFEPGSSSGLVQFPPSKLIGNIVRVVREGGGFILVNEVTTGVGQTGKWFGYQHYGISPDIVALGKGIGNGYPVSVTAIAPEVIQRLGDTPVNYAQSHQNDPLGAAVVREVVRIISEDNLIERSEDVANTLATGLEEIKQANTRIQEIRSRGLMIAIELNDDSSNSFTVRVHHELMRRGFIVGRRPGVKVLRLDPSLTTDLKDIEIFLKIFKDVMTEIESGAEYDGGASRN